MGPSEGGEPRRSGAGSLPEMPPAWGFPRGPLIPTIPGRPVRPCLILPHPGPLPASQARPLPDVGAAQGESQQVEHSAAHAQANEADHRDELREDRGNFQGQPPPNRPLQAFLLGPPSPPPRVWRPLLSAREDRQPPTPHFCLSLPQPIASLSEVDSRDTEGILQGWTEGTLKKY